MSIGNNLGICRILRADKVQNKDLPTRSRTSRKPPPSPRTWSWPTRQRPERSWPRSSWRAVTTPLRQRCQEGSGEGAKKRDPGSQGLDFFPLWSEPPKGLSYGSMINPGLTQTGNSPKMTKAVLAHRRIHGGSKTVAAVVDSSGDIHPQSPWTQKV